ncbi:hypothetical protein ACN5LO_004043 [Cronobacter sakazakii]
MNNIEKMTSVGQVIYGDHWQSPLSRAMGISSRTIRNFISGETAIPVNLSGRLLAAAEVEMEKIQAAIEIINSDKMCGDDVTIEMIADIADRYEYADEQDRKNATDAMNNKVYEVTYLSDLDAIARKFAR